jgi:hypothetical protein
LLCGALYGFSAIALITPDEPLRKHPSEEADKRRDGKYR